MRSSASTRVARPIRFSASSTTRPFQLAYVGRASQSRELLFTNRQRPRLDSRRLPVGARSTHFPREAGHALKKITGSQRLLLLLQPVNKYLSVMAFFEIRPVNFTHIETLPKAQAIRYLLSGLLWRQLQ